MTSINSIIDRNVIVYNDKMSIMTIRWNVNVILLLIYWAFKYVYCRLKTVQTNCTFDTALDSYCNHIYCRSEWPGLISREYWIVNINGAHALRLTS